MHTNTYCQTVQNIKKSKMCLWFTFFEASVSYIKLGHTQPKLVKSYKLPCFVSVLFSTFITQVLNRIVHDTFSLTFFFFKSGLCNLNLVYLEIFKYKLFFQQMKVFCCNIF